MPRTDIDGALEVAERLRRATAATPVAAGDLHISVTVSGGCVLSTGDQADAVLQLADTSLYQAKGLRSRQDRHGISSDNGFVSAEEWLDTKRDHIHA